MLDPFCLSHFEKLSSRHEAQVHSIVDFESDIDIDLFTRAWQRNFSDIHLKISRTCWWDKLYGAIQGNRVFGLLSV